MQITKEEKAQGATEYLLMLATALVIVAVAIYYVMNLKGVSTGLFKDSENKIMENIGG